MDRFIEDMVGSDLGWVVWQVDQSQTYRDAGNFLRKVRGKVIHLIHRQINNFSVPADGTQCITILTDQIGVVPCETSFPPDRVTSK